MGHRSISDPRGGWGWQWSGSPREFWWPHALMFCPHCSLNYTLWAKSFTTI